MGRGKHRLLPDSLCYLSLFLECSPVAFTIILCLFLTRFIEQGRKKEAGGSVKKQFITKKIKKEEKRKEKKPVTTITTTPADRSRVMLRFSI